MDKLDQILAKCDSWKESDHPRDDDGKFGSGGGRGKKREGKKPQSQMGMDEIRSGLQEKLAKRGPPGPQSDESLYRVKHNLTFMGRSEEQIRSQLKNSGFSDEQIESSFQPSELSEKIKKEILQERPWLAEPKK